MQVATAHQQARSPAVFGAAKWLLAMAALPWVAFYLFLSIRAFGGLLVLPTTRYAWAQVFSQMPAPTGYALKLYLSWLLFQVALQIIVPGRIHSGMPLSDGTRLDYKMNGWTCFLLTLFAAVTGVRMGWISPTVLYDHFGPLLATANVFAFVFAVILFLLGKTSPRVERVPGNLLQDYFFGRALNPRIGSFDLKLFCESRPGLLLWLLIDLSMAAEQYRRYGAVSAPMILVVAFQLLYVGDYFFHESGILSTWDVRHENFGWMLCWGDLVWVPFIFSLQAHYLVLRPDHLSGWEAAGTSVVNMTGYWIFRSANNQKDRFRNDPTALLWGEKPKFIPTATGSSLLVSGWWAISRHMNYLGDLLMALAWSLPTGFTHPLPYFYFVYSAALLIHRERRDYAMCLAKYGESWKRYCTEVRWRILPGVY
jgi:Ergosterol biosynthesis ERG4/ERG24 family